MQVIVGVRKGIQPVLLPCSMPEESVTKAVSSLSVTMIHTAVHKPRYSANARKLPNAGSTVTNGDLATWPLLCLSCNFFKYFLNCGTLWR